MSILADLQAIVGDALGGEFSNALYYRTVPGASDGQGGFLKGREDIHNCKAMVDRFSESQIRGGVPASDRKIVVLGASLPANLTPMPGDTVRVGRPGKAVTLDDRLWAVVAVESDPANATWELQAQ